MVLGISQLFKSNVLESIGRRTLTIMGTHQLIIYAVVNLQPYISDNIVVKGLQLVIVIIAFEIPVIWFLEKYASFCLGRKM